MKKQLLVTATTLHFLRVNAQMHNLDKQKTACSRKTLAVSLKRHDNDNRMDSIFDILHLLVSKEKAK